MARQISLQRVAQKVEEQSYQFTVTATGTDMVHEIFVLRRRPLDPLVGSTTDVFDHVATPVELTQLTVNAPLSGQSTFRVRSLVLVFENAADGDEAWLSLQGEVNALIRALNAADDVLTPETVVLTG